MAQHVLAIVHIVRDLYNCSKLLAASYCKLRPGISADLRAINPKTHKVSPGSSCKEVNLGILGLDKIYSPLQLLRSVVWINLNKRNQPKVAGCYSPCSKLLDTKWSNKAPSVKQPSTLKHGLKIR